MPKVIKDNPVAKEALKAFSEEELDLASRILYNENNPKNPNFNKNVESSNKNSDGSYDEGLFQHNTEKPTNKKTPVDKREYSGTQKDINKIFNSVHGRNYDVFNPKDNAEATKLWIENIKTRIEKQWKVKPTDEMVMYFYHKGAGNFSLTMKNNLLDKLNKHKYITNSLAVRE